jgi:tripartite ATP-independent transporter DctM subunit
MTVALFVGTLLLAMVIGVPIAFALMLAAIAIMFHMNMLDDQIVALNLMTGVQNFSLMAIPFFILAGEFMGVGGLSQKIINLASAFVGHFRGGVGYVAIIGGILFASLSGSAVADSAMLAAIMIPMMVKSGYSREHGAGLIAGAGIIAPIIPPSIAFITFGVASNVSITKLFMAGIFPGLYLAASLTFVWWLISRKNEGAVLPKKTWKERWEVLKDSGWALFLPILIIGGMRFGIFTPTEAAIVAAVYALFVGTVVYRKIKWRELYECFIAAAKQTSTVMFLIAASLVAAWMITVANIPLEIAKLLGPLIDHPLLLMIVINLLVFIIGTSMDLTPTILILTPVLFPIIKMAGIDPVYFGVVFIINCAIGLLTPPVGTVINVVGGVAKLNMDRTMKGVWPFLLAETVVLVLLIFFPQLVTVPAGWLTK